MLSVRSRTFHCLRSHVRSFSEAPVPRPPLVETSGKPNARVASNLNGISIPHKNENNQHQQMFTYRPNVGYPKTKPGLAAQLAMRNSNVSKTSTILGKEGQANSPRPAYARGKATEGQGPRTRPQVNVGPRTERRPRLENGRPPTGPPRDRKVNAQDKRPQNPNRPNDFGPNAGNGPRRGPGGFTPRAMPPRAPQSPSSNRQQFTPRHASSNSSSKDAAARKKARGKRGAKKGEEADSSDAVHILDQCPPEVAFTPDFAHSDMKNLSGSSSEIVQRPRSVFENVGGDYSRYIPQANSKKQDSKSATIGIAEAALGRRREVGLAQKSKVVDVVKRSVGFKSAQK